MRFALNIGIGAVMGVWCCGAPVAAEPKAPSGPLLAVIEENDLLSDPFTPHHQDRHYTHGIKLVYLGADDRLAPGVESFARWLPRPGIFPVTHNAGVVLGQNMYTPEDILAVTLIVDDRPYAGWLYTGVVLQRRGFTPVRQVPVLESFEINLGIIGPESLAKEAQRTIHRWRFPDDIPEGWHNQLDTEPGLVLKYGRLWRFRPVENLDLLPHVGAALGNVHTFGTLGATLRLGWNLPEDFGVQTIDSTATVHGGTTGESPAWGFQLFGRIECRAVARNIFLDGNSYRDSHRVDRRPLVADFTWGFALQMTRHVELSYTRILRTEEFEGQRGNDLFGSLTLKGKFDF